ncbi:polynucleotide kinase 3 phosphatase-domain-containing protein [Favolaschia claudopus]|uniref:Polynucleotide kinase 3 phosphatase-domain-containing protein n=1 Tax=Favolaschia claudopus TaxID=2862362 RepID=A0AAW0EGU1_9AGAR
MASSSSTAQKRKLDTAGDTNAPNKAAKVHPFFTKKPAVDEQSTSSGSFRWLKAFGPDRSCLHATSMNPPSLTKVAAFDLDGTVIEGGFKQPASEWKWWNACVPGKLAEAANAGYSVVIISNQNGLLKGAKPMNAWKAKIESIASTLPDVPFRIFGAVAKDRYRKPMTGMWDELEKIYAEDGVQIDKTSSFFVGDAAGRNFPRNPSRRDFASTDRKWALNIEIPFMTPEEYFLSRAPDPEFTLKGLDVSTLPKLPLYTPSSTPIVPAKPTQELILLVGYPCLGKTTFFRRHFEPVGYIHINQDTLKRRESCVKAVQEALAEGKKCVVDNTNRDASTRRFYVDLAKKNNVPIRCMVFTGSLELAWHNNLYRAFGLPPSVSGHESPREELPKSAFASFRDNYEEPELSEGFAEIKKVNWVFEGTEEERKMWAKWFPLFDDKEEKGNKK